MSRKNSGGVTNCYFIVSTLYLPRFSLSPSPSSLVESASSSPRRAAATAAPSRRLFFLCHRLLPSLNPYHNPHFRSPNPQFHPVVLSRFLVELAFLCRKPRTKQKWIYHSNSLFISLRGKPLPSPQGLTKFKG